MTNIQKMLEFRKAVQIFLATLDPDTQADTMLSCPSVFPMYEVGKQYKIKDVFQYGLNNVGDAQLYQVMQDHVSADNWKPDETPSLYKKIGMIDGVPEWVQPLGAADAYNTGDVVMYKGVKYRSLMDANVYAPDVYPAGWEVVS